MSEYQYYEFRALDRPLTTEEQDEVRKLSSRAEIGPTSFINVYNYGDFHGDPLELMKRYYDAFLYEANWGTREFMLRLPASLIDPATVASFAVEGALDVTIAGDNVIVGCLSDDEEGSGWIEVADSAAWLPRLVPLRDELLSGDLRGLYLAWLMAIQMDGLEDGEVEPPVPAGLRALSVAQKALVNFLRVDEDLLAIAAEASPAMPRTPSPAGEFERWVRELPETNRTELLLRFVKNEEPHLRMELSRRFREQAGREGNIDIAAEPGRRSVAELLGSAAVQRKRRLDRKAEALEKERARKQAEAEAARSRYLDRLVGKEAQTWSRIEALIEMRRPAEYDQAVKYLVDLQELAAREDDFESFESQLKKLRKYHQKKVNLIAKMDSAGLPAD